MEKHSPESRTAGNRPTTAKTVRRPEPQAPTISHFWTPDQQIKFFRNRGEFSPVRVVPRGDHAYPLPTVVHQISPRWIWKGRAMDVESYMAAYPTSGVIVLKDSQVLLERYGLGRTANDVWDGQSVAKSITAILVGAAIQDGYVTSMDDLVSDYVPQLKSGAFDGVTIRELFTMSSGVKFDDNWRDPDGNATRFAVWPYANEDPASYLSRLPRVDRPGAKWVYNNADAHIAGILVSTATGKFLSAYLAEKLWKPFGMESNAYWMVTPAGHEFGDGSISMTLRDYGRVGLFMLEGGKAGGIQVVPPEWLAEATRAQILLSPEKGVTAATGYGYYWWICSGAYFALGYAGQRIYVSPKDNLVIALNSALPKGGSPEDLQALSAFIQALHMAAAQSCGQ